MLVLTPQSDAHVAGYLGSYLRHRDYAARHAPYAVTRAPREWIAGKPVIVKIKNSTILWVRFTSRKANVWERRLQELERSYLEPLAYYYFLPLVEADCSLNGHPSRRDYDWKFFGRNLE